MATNAQVSTLLSLLPAVFQEDRKARDPNFLGRFLLAFEELLLGLEGSPIQGLEATIAQIWRYFRPVSDVPGQLESGDSTPKDFLEWLASWVALTLREDWAEGRQRELIAKAVYLYRLRGTRQGLEEYIRVYTEHDADVDDYTTPFQIGVHSTIDADTYLGGSPWPAFHFRVRVLVKPRPDLVAAARLMVPAIIDLQKPAHTDYEFVLVPIMFQVGIHPRIGEDSFLG